MSAEITKPRVAVVVATHIPVTEQWSRALDAAVKNYGEAQVIVVDDSPGQDLQFPHGWVVLGRGEQEKLTAPRYEQFQKFQRSSSCKSLGVFYAWREEFDVIIGLDSDCVVPHGYIGQHLEGLKRQGYGWTNPIVNTGWFPRGYPYAERKRKVVGSLGLWHGTLDLGGKDRLENGQEPDSPMLERPHTIADGFLPFSGMNWAVLREAIPGLLFLPNFSYERTKFRRHDDIWGGYVFQRFMEKRNERLVYGDPLVDHVSPVDAQADAKEEEGATAFENQFYTAVDQAMEAISPGSYEDMLAQFALYIKDSWKETEFEPLAEAYAFWLNLFMGTTIENDEEVSA